MLVLLVARRVELVMLDPYLSRLFILRLLYAESIISAYAIQDFLTPRVNHGIETLVV